MLTEVMVAVAASGGTAVAQAAGTDAWTGLRHRVARLLGRGDPQTEQAELDRLDQTAAALTGPAGEDAGAGHAAEWQARFEALLESLDDPERDRAAAELRALAEEAGVTTAGGSVSGNTFAGPAVFMLGDHNRQVNNFGK